MKRYLKNIALFFSPLLLILLLYFVLDPFKVLRSYDSYYESGKPEYVVLNRGYVSTETFVQQYPRQKYNAFIFGNSRSLFWQIEDWMPHLPDGASCFHFDGSDESLFSLHRKLRFLDAQGVDIAHAILVVDFSLLNSIEARSGHLIVTAPRLMEYDNVLSFHGSFLLSYLDPRFLLAYYDFSITGQFRDYMRDHNVLNAEPMQYDLASNEIRYPQFERAIAEGRYYEGSRRSVFSKRGSTPHVSPACLKSQHLRLLDEIAAVFAEHGTDARVVISPLYNQRQLHGSDVQALKRIFGEDHVFDYSGVNDITADYHNYYELSHYRPHVAAGILREMY